jgi:hypothetical protein
VRVAAARHLALLAVLCGTVPAGAQRRSTLDERAAQVAALFRATPGGFEGLFAKEFLARVTPPRLTSILMDLHQKFGPVRRTVLTARDRPDTASYDFILQQGYSVPVRLTVADAAPHLITNLLVGAPVRLAATLEEIVRELRALPGEVSFLAARLERAGPRPLAALDPERRLAIASGFKLYVLGALVQELEAGRRRWSDVSTLEPASRSLPSGILQTWPAGAPLTLHTLATLMVTMSDNTATDQLIRTLGRDRVEQHQRRMGHGEPGLNVPFLLTQEFFKLEGDPEGRAGPAYAALDVRGRRAFLASGLAGLKLADLVLPERPRPQEMRAIEWFASAGDLGRALAWLRDHTSAKATAPGRSLLAINPGTQLSGGWRTVCYKGGNEPGVRSMAFLLESHGGQWFILAAVWNSDAAVTDEGRLSALLGRAAQLLR